MSAGPDEWVRVRMISISTATRVITFPARTTLRLLGWAAEQAFGQGSAHSTSRANVPAARPIRPDVDPMAPTRTVPAPPPAKKAPARKAPAKKVPAGQVPLKSAPTPSLPAGVEAIDAAVEAAAPAPRSAPAKKAPATKTPAKKTAATKAPAKKTAATKTPAKKTAAKKAPSKQAAVLAPALGLSEDEVTKG